MSDIEEHPKRLKRTLLRLRREGEEPVDIFPANPKRYMDEKSVILSRIGMLDESRIRSWLVATKENLIFVKAGLLWNREEKVPLESITDVKYVKEFHDNTIKIRIGDMAEDVRFYDEAEGIRFYRFIKNKEWKSQ